MTSVQELGLKAHQTVMDGLKLDPAKMKPSFYGLIGQDPLNFDAIAGPKAAPAWKDMSEASFKNPVTVPIWASDSYMFVANAGVYANPRLVFPKQFDYLDGLLVHDTITSILFAVDPAYSLMFS
ncbi:MAG TPA: hypothetical protein VI387_06595, partial [Candidatus Brocadiales bacterium]|nr:hypothetical protein [Candidatus Brocadiales bacterium]